MQMHPFTGSSSKQASSETLGLLGLLRGCFGVVALVISNNVFRQSQGTQGLHYIVGCFILRIAPFTSLVIAAVFL